MGRPFKLGEGELALLRRLHMLEREELGKASRCFSLGTLLACGDLEGETRVSRRWRWEERWQGRLKAVSIVCRLGIDIPGIPEAAEAGEASSMKRDSSLREGWSESSLLFLPAGCKLILLSPCSPGCSSSIGKVSKFSLNSSSILTWDEWSTWSTNRSKITSAAISAMLVAESVVGWWRLLYN